MMEFRNRLQAAEKLAEKLSELKGKNPLILGVPRGAVPMAKVIAERLEGELDIILVHKVGAPHHPEFAVASVTEDGDVFLGRGAQQLGLDEELLQGACETEVRALQAKRELFTPGKQAVDPQGRICVVVDDGIATGATVTAALRWLQARGAETVVIATPVASSEAVTRLTTEGAEVVSLLIPPYFYSVSLFYEDFSQVEDEDVIQALAGFHQNGDFEEVTVRSQGIELKANLTIPPRAKGIVLFAHGSGSGRHSTRNQWVAKKLNERGFATLLADLLSEEESRDRRNVFDIQLLAERLAMLSEWANESPRLRRLPIGFFGASTGAAAALQAAAALRVQVNAVVSRGGRPDLADRFLSDVTAPTLLIVGSADYGVIELNEEAYEKLRCEKNLKFVLGATHLFEEPGALDEVARLAGEWFSRYLARETQGIRPETSVES